MGLQKQTKQTANNKQRSPIKPIDQLTDSYGLLGPSGSGKTTLLKSVVGQLTPTEGWVKVFGFQPNQPGSQIPGAAIGYMPQELAVYEDFTIKETLWYFGRLYRIPKALIKERIEFLLTFLDLPRSSRLILNMSGGQKRRVSLASALVHSPPLLILDEPTVGVDPLLRQSIWQHLVTLTQTEKITVIVTTHYIEEARRANIVGLMRRGKLLAENTPEDLMAKHDSSSLEDVFLKLCVSDTMRRAQKFASLTGIPVQAAITGTSSVIPTPEIQSKRAHPHHNNSNNHHNHHHHQYQEPTTEHHQQQQQQQHHKHHHQAGDMSVASSGVSQSPDEGVNTSSSAHNSSSSSEHSSSNSGSGEDSVSASDDTSPRPDKLAGAAVAGSQNSSSGSTASPVPTDESQQQQQAGKTHSDLLDAKELQARAVNTLANQQQRVASPMTAAPIETEAEVATSSANKGWLKPKPNEPSSKNAKKFQLKSLLKMGPSKAQMERKELERRRQSGSFFIEQLMSKYEQEQRAPLDQMLSCDTTANAGVGQQQHQHQSSSSVAHLDVPKIAIHGSNFVDSGASSNGSSQSHSPTGGQVQQQALQRRQASGGNLMAYANHSYQPSECGSTTFNDLALISSQAKTGAADNDHHQYGSQYGTGNGGCSVNIQANHLDDDVELDPELFMNPADLSTMSPGGKYDYKKQSVREYCDTISTITWKNYIRLKRNVPLLLFQFVLPAIQVVLFCICVGNDPFDISVAIVNEESSADSIAALSTQFLHSIDRHLVKQVNFSDLPSAIDSVRNGKNWGVVHIPENFTISIHKRFAGLEVELDDATLENSTIKVYPDMTNQPIGHAMEVAFRRAYSDLSKQTFEFLGLNPALSDPPIRMQDAIYGKIDIQNYLQYMSPGVLISISYIMATGLTSLAFIIERRDGLYDRTLAAGVDHVQMLLSHSIVQLLVMIVQISLVVFFTFVIYKVPTNGPFVWVFLLLLLQGLAGMSFGLMVSAICKEENTAIMMILGTFYPNLLLAGVIWPIEAIPYWLRWFSYLQPQTLPTQSLRNLIVRGWDIDQTGVWSGFAVTSAWLLLFLAISCISFKIKK